MMARAASAPDRDHVLVPSLPTVSEHPDRSKTIPIAIQAFMIIFVYRISSRTHGRRGK
jgi:hypothetical protein